MVGSWVSVGRLQEIKFFTQCCISLKLLMQFVRTLFSAKSFRDCE